ncbi:DUF917 domain-containing protein [Sciscionella marina]|uniref:DUF917 domain-containing protein n=1 Tax=Sciscionella marina TaxID=508770 RepID=UPI000382CCFD|nr:DUF917 domain-containing protein [Sciscionella marina]
MNHIDANAIADIARGAAVLGAGGGGDPHLGALMAERAITDSGPVRTVGLPDLPEDAVVLPVAIMGAPTVIVEKPPAGGEFAQAVRAVQTAYGSTITHIACFEAGGLNSMMPLVCAAETNLPLIDGDGMGRAFPELQMVLATLDGISTTPMAMVDDKGNTVLLDTVDNAWAEQLARSATVEMGCGACIALYPMTGREARKALVPDTVSLAGRLGRLLRATRGDHRDPVEALITETDGVILFHGRVTDVRRRTKAGFARGQAEIQGTGPDTGASMTLHFQNEHLLATRDGAVVASVPDLICVLEADTGEPITTEAMRYGFRVTVIGLPCHPRWRSPAGLALVGPSYFGYEHEYVPLDRLNTASIA